MSRAPQTSITVLFTVLGYPMSLRRAHRGRILYLASVLAHRPKRNILTWPVGMVSVASVHGHSSTKIRLYSDALEQVYYLGASVYGWWYWSRSPTRALRPLGRELQRASGHDDGLGFGYGDHATLAAVLGLRTMSHVHEWAPRSRFRSPRRIPYLDARDDGHEPDRDVATGSKAGRELGCTGLWWTSSGWACTT